MILSKAASAIYQQINSDTRLGDLRAIAKKINKDHFLAQELWSTGELLPRLLAILIFDKKELSVAVVDLLIRDIEGHTLDERLQLADWLLANQLTKDKKTIAMLQSWQQDDSAIKRRLYWYYQGRLRWTGQKPPDNTSELLTAIEQKMLNEEPEVQWAMNFTAAWIGVFDAAYRNHCIALGEKLGLYRDEIVPRNCTPNYLPKFIAGEVAKRNK